MWATVRGVCTRPRATFERLGARPSLRGPFVVVYGQAVLALLTILVPALARYEGLVSSSPPLSLTTAAGTVAIPRLWVEWIVNGVVIPLFDWVWLTLLFAVGAILVVRFVARREPAESDDAGETPPGPGRRAETVGAGTPDGTEPGATLPGRVRRTFAVVGWGLLPQLPAYLLTGAIVVLYAVVGLPVEDGYVVITAARHPVAHAAGLPLIVFATHAVGALCTCWSGYVWHGGIVATWDISRRAAAAVVVPLTLALIVLSDVLHVLHPAV